MAHHHVTYLKDYTETEQDNVEFFIQRGELDSLKILHCT